MNEFQIRTFQARFVTPAFLGNADQAGQWRTPPFKAALRQWWRIVMAREVDFSSEKLYVRERKVFGCAVQNSSKKSPVQLRLSNWDKGRKNQLDNSQFKRIEGKNIHSHQYLGYGPITKSETKSSLLDTQEAKLSLRFPDCHAKEIDQTLRLLGWFGALGSRSRNGWGSLHMERVKDTGDRQIEPFSGEVIAPFMREITDCLELDWPHAFGMDQGSPLVWQSGPIGTWQRAIDLLADLKTDIRKKAKEYKSNQIAGIHLLGYPAGRKWNLPNKNLRLASPIRFKVLLDTERKQYQCLVFHIPTALPKTFRLSDGDQRWLSENQIKVFREVHMAIDAHQNGTFQRID